MTTLPMMHVGDTVNHLIEVCRDGEEGFKTAADAVNPMPLKTELLKYSRDRAGFANALSHAMEQMGQAHVNHGTASGLVHRGWINLVRLKPGGNEHAVLAACESGEDAAVDAYNDAMREHLPGRVGELVAAQFQVVKGTHDRIRNLRDLAGEA